MDGKQRRQEILKWMKNSNGPVSGEKLAKALGVSRQVIVQDIALLRAADYDILATNRGYLCTSLTECSRVFHVNHKNEDILEELNIIVDFGATIVDVFVEHEPYGELRAPLDIHTRREALEFVGNINSGNSSPLMTITCGDHYHTVKADSELTLNEIEAELHKHGFLKT
ncbi:transcription repressor NadR [Qiania dongpingensis]|uniref:Transcription repressor NadR n=1 Tax=Qiania dongpingensis TaxID=2763669 RepID=A0A7G9G0I1_9FIRM|nr:transcription repressor NadR [Qiania dongpingensis]QNM04313.1 transcription repressor NadR [Qiania dongpingensis]